MWTALALTLAASSLAPAQDPAPPEALVYNSARGVDLCWLAPGRLALASDGGLRVVDLTGEAPALVFRSELELVPRVAATEGRLAGVTTLGEVVVWDTADWSERGRRVGVAAGSAPPVLALVGEDFLVGDGHRGLTRVDLGGNLPRPLDYPGPGAIEDLVVRPDGGLLVLPSCWTWDPTGGGWSTGLPLQWTAADGANRLAGARGGELAAAFRSEPSLALALDPLVGEGAPLRIDLSYRRPLSMGLGPGGALLSFPGAAGTAGYGSQEVTQTELLGSLERYDAATGTLTARLPREDAPAGFADAADHRTLVLGRELAAAGPERWVTLDLVDHQGQPTWWLRLRGPDLVALAEARVEGAGEARMYLMAAPGRVAVAHEEQAVEVFGIGPDEATGEPALTPGATIPISAQDDPTGATTPAPRRVFALHPSGELMAMVSDSGTVFFANPATGWPHRVISVRLPREAVRPLAARFLEGGELVVTATVAGEEGAEGEPVPRIQELTLDAQQGVWAPGVDVPGPRLVAGARQARLTQGDAGNLDLFDLAGLTGPRHLARLVLGLARIDGLAVGPDGDLAVAAGGRILHVGGR